MTGRLGRADLHIHTLASDGTMGAIEVLEHVEANLDLDVIAITDHERIDAAVAARAVARERGYRVEVVIGEEVTTLGGHLLALWIEETIRPCAARSRRSTSRAVSPSRPIPSSRSRSAPRASC
jgi:predicted metal-dependent phosphoesterase TrpH